MNETVPPISGYPPQPKTSGLAIWSLVLGFLSLACFSILCAIPGVICGHKALSKIKHSGGTLSGQGLAIAGLVMGYIGLLLAVILIVPDFLKAFGRAHDKAMRIECINNLREIEAAKNEWASEKGKKMVTFPRLKTSSRISKTVCSRLVPPPAPTRLVLSVTYPPAQFTVTVRPVILLITARAVILPARR